MAALGSRASTRSPRCANSSVALAGAGADIDHLGLRAQGAVVKERVDGRRGIGRARAVIEFGHPSERQALLVVVVAWRRQSAENSWSNARAAAIPSGM